MPRVGEVLEEKYVLRDKLATGGMGIILKAEDRKLERDVAVKLLHPRLVSDRETVERFRREIDLAKRLTHPNIVQLLDYGRTDTGVLFIIMEYLEGEDLDDLVKREGPLAFDRSLEIILQVLDGLAEAHDRDLIHRDLKPSNVFLTKRRRGGEHAKLLDFGVAKSLSERESTLTKTGSACGTAMYMPPESLFDKNPSKRIDVYAVGLMTLEMLMGRRVFDAGSLPQTLMMHVTQPVSMPADLAGTPVGEVLERATSKHPDERYRDGVEMLQALNDAADEMPDDFDYDPHETVEVGSTIDRIEFGGPSDLSASNLQALEGVGAEESTDRLPQTAPAETPSPDGHPAAPAEESGDFESAPTTPQSSAFSDVIAEQETPSEASRQIDAAVSGLLDRVSSWPPWAWAAALTGSLTLVALLALLIPWGGGAPEQANSTEAAAPGPADRASAGDEAAPSALHFEEESDTGSTTQARSGPYEVRIHSKPQGATVYRDGRELGTTPDTFELETDGAEPIPLNVRLEGYLTASLTVDPSSGRSAYTAHLQRDPKPTAAESSPEEQSDPSGARDSPENRSAGTNDPDPSPPPARRRPEPDPKPSSASSSGGTDDQSSGSDDNAFEEIADDYTID